MKKLFLFLAIFTVSFCIVSFAEASEASLSIYPQTESFTVGNTFDVSIFLNTGGEDVSVV